MSEELNLEGLPPMILRELSVTLGGKSGMIVETLKESGALEFNVDIVLIAVYRTKKIIMKRRATQLHLYRLKKAGYIESADRCGWFKWPETAPGEHICGIPESEFA